MKRRILVLFISILSSLAACNNREIISSYASAEIGDIIQLGGHDWRVLDVQDDKVLIMSDKILARIPYHNIGIHEARPSEPITWEKCNLREYLNGEFYEATFSKNEKTYIADTKVVNNANPWFNTPGGNDTTDKVFLLSIEEVVQYFGDSERLQNRPVNEWYQNQPSNVWLLSDEYDQGRIAEYKDIGAAWWWLRSPGNNEYYGGRDTASRVLIDGTVDFNGVYTSPSLYGNIYDGGVRPALWLKL